MLATAPPAETPSLWDAAHDVDAQRPRSLQRQLGASDTVCQRRAAYLLAGTKPSDSSDKRAAILGTYIHEGLLGAAHRLYRWLIESTVQGSLIRGHIDGVQLDQATASRLPARHRPRVHATAHQGVVVEDVKTKSTYLWDRVLRYGATAAELRQVYLYAWLLRTEGFADVRGQRYLHRLGPINVRTIRFRFINRDNGEEFVQEFAYDPLEAERARWWVERVTDLPGPHAAQRDHDGPGLSPVCDNCPFRTLCWPTADPPGAAPQSVVVRDDADRAQALRDYVRGSELEKEGKQIRDLARRKLDASPAGIYGDNELSWTGGKPKREPDVQAMVDILEDAGITVPMVPNADAMIRKLRGVGVAVPERLTGAKSTRAISVRAVQPRPPQAEVAAPPVG